MSKRQLNRFDIFTTINGGRELYFMFLHEREKYPNGNAECILVELPSKDVNIVTREINYDTCDIIKGFGFVCTDKHLDDRDCYNSQFNECLCNDPVLMLEFDDTTREREESITMNDYIKSIVNSSCESRQFIDIYRVSSNEEVAEIYGMSEADVPIVVKEIVKKYKIKRDN